MGEQRNQQPVRAHPEWPAKDGVDIGCDDRECEMCYSAGKEIPALLTSTLDGQPLTAEEADLLARDEAYRARAESLDIFEDEENPPWEM